MAVKEPKSQTHTPCDGSDKAARRAARSHDSQELDHHMALPWFVIEIHEDDLLPRPQSQAASLKGNHQRWAEQ